MGNRKITVDIHDIMHQMGIPRNAFEIFGTNNGSYHTSANDRIQQSRNSEQEQPRKEPSRKEWQTDPVELVAASS